MPIPSLNGSTPFRPLVVGCPRSGFALLCSILSHLLPLAAPKGDLRQRLLNAVIEAFGDHIWNSVRDAYAAKGTTDDLIYNPSFRHLVGGPKWIDDDNPDLACIRKYVGARGKGDFTLITKHPIEVLDFDAIVHSHSNPSRWLEHARYDGYEKFASVRNPIGIVNSALLSLNALTSEYIQRFVPPEHDDDSLRQRLALYKYTDLDFFEGLVSFYRRYFDEFMPVRDRYIVMRWEDLIASPARTIGDLARAAGLSVDGEHAEEIWRRLDHVNLTGNHKHNFRKGGGKVGDWKNWITNRHLDILRDYGFDGDMAALGYDPIPRLDPDAYTPFQRRVDDMLERGEVFTDNPDPDLFGFAFNKSNLDSEKFSFKRYGWKKATRVERSSFADEDSLFEMWAAADSATERLNATLNAVLAGRYETAGDARAALAAVRDAAVPLAKRMPRAGEAALPMLETLVRDWFEHGRTRPARGFDFGLPPQLVRAYRRHNVVRFRGWYYGIPHSAGPMDLKLVEIDRVPGVIRADSYAEAQKGIDSLEQSAKATDAGPRLVADMNGYNIVTLGGKFWGIPQALGPIDLTPEILPTLPGAIGGKTLGEVESLIVAAGRSSLSHG